MSFQIGIRGASCLVALTAAVLAVGCARHEPPGDMDHHGAPQGMTTTGTTTDGEGTPWALAPPGHGESRQKLKVAVVYLKLEACNQADPAHGQIDQYPPDKIAVWLNNSSFHMKQVAWIVQAPDASLQNHEYVWTIEAKDAGEDGDVPPARTGTDPGKTLTIPVGSNQDQVFISDLPNPQKPSPETWTYHVTLDQDGAPCARIDPDVIIYH